MIEPSKEQPAVVRVGVAVLVHREHLGQNEYLLGLRKGSHGAGTWSVPGGHLELGETVAACAERELAEETGIRAACEPTGEYVHTVFLAEERTYVTLYAQIVQEDLLEGTEAKLLEPAKCAAWRWVPWGNWPGPLFPPFRDYVDMVRRWETGR